MLLSRIKQDEEGFLCWKGVMAKCYILNLTLNKEVVEFYTNLVGTSSPVSPGVHIAALRRGKTLGWEKARSLIIPLTEAEIWKAVQGIGINKAPGVDGFWSMFYKASW